MKQSAGLLVYRVKKGTAEVLLVHPGGPFWAKKDRGVWSIPKGEFKDEDALAAAKREFKEETGWRAPEGEYHQLGSVKLSSGKVIYAWAVEGDLNARSISSNSFEMEWPPRSGQKQSFPEVDRAAWFSLNDARQKLIVAQSEFISQLATLLHIDLEDKAVFPAPNQESTQASLF